MAAGQETGSLIKAFFTRRDTFTTPWRQQMIGMFDAQTGWHLYCCQITYVESYISLLSIPLHRVGVPHTDQFIKMGT